MRNGFHFFKNGIEVDCSAHPLDPSPAAAAVTAEIGRIRAHSDKPIFVLAGELHNRPEQVLLPFAFMLRNGLLSSTSPPALLGRFQMSLEAPHNMLADFLRRRVAPTPPDQQIVNMMVKSDFIGERLLHVLQMQEPLFSVHARYFLHESLLRGKISTFASDASHFSYKNSRGDVISIMDSTDTRTGFLIRSFGDDENSINPGSSAGMAVRNAFTALRLRAKGMERGMVTWHQAGLAHIVGDEQDGLEFGTSLSAIFDDIIGPDSAHAIVVLPLDEAFSNEEQIPDAAVDCTATVIGVRGLSQSPPAPGVEEWRQAKESIEVISSSVGKEALQLPLLQLKYYQKRRALIATTLFPQWEAAAKQCIQQRKSGGMAEPRLPALS